MSRSVSAHPRCPSEASLEAWAIRNARERRLARGRRHLEQCASCRQRHDRLFRFYGDGRSGALPVPARAGAVLPPRPISDEPILTRPVIHTLHPFVAAHTTPVRRQPVAVTSGLLAAGSRRLSMEGDFLSSDGSIQARRIDPDFGSLVWLRVASDPPALGHRALVLLEQGSIPYQSDALGLVRALPGPPPASIGRIEVVSGIGRAFYGGAQANGTRMIPPQVILDAGPVGAILVEQEEGDAGEPVLGLCLPGVPRSMRARRLFAAFAPGGGPALVEEMVAGEAYFYGADLFEPFTIWVYAR